MTVRVDLGKLKTGDWERLQEITDRFEQAWLRATDASTPVDLGQFLPPVGDQLRPAALVELVSTELEIRWRRGQVISIDTYLEKYPELGPARDLPAKLVYEEFRIRHLFGDKPSIDKYRTRFPAQFVELEQIIRESPIETLPFATDEVPPREDTAILPSRPPTAVASKPAATVIPGKTVLNATNLMFGGYTALKRIGSGSYGEVWKAEAPGGVEVAVKLITRPIQQAEAQQEQQALELMKNLRHPYLVQTHRYELLEDRLFIAMELADSSLRERLRECVKDGKAGIPLPELMGYMRESAEALDFLHGENVHHRDIKPENILVLKRHAKVADFGLARLLECQRELINATTSGTPAYMAPEVWSGLISPHSDQYSLAVTYVELRLGRRLFESRSMADLMRSHTEENPDLAPLEEAEQKVLFKALTKKPDDRYSSCLEFVHALEEAITPKPPPPEPTQVIVEVIREVPAKRRRLVSAVFALAALVPAVFVTYWGLSSKTPDLAPFVPPGFAAVGDEVVTDFSGKKFYSRIIPVSDDAKGTEFILIPETRKELQPGKPDLKSYYIMENKVSVELFRKFDTDHSGLVKDREWTKNAKDEKHPVLGVLVSDAYTFADTWFQGNLPSADQWDKATGFFDDPRTGEGPYRGSWSASPKPDIAVELLTPRPIGDAKDDISPYGCRDLAGNGQEWTRSTLEGGSLPIPPPQKDELVLMQLRGRQYAAPDPFRYAFLEGNTSPNREAWKYETTNSQLGFRVVVEP